MTWSEPLASGARLLGLAVVLVTLAGIAWLAALVILAAGHWLALAVAGASLGGWPRWMTAALAVALWAGMARPWVTSRGR